MSITRIRAYILEKTKRKGKSESHSFARKITKIPKVSKLMKDSTPQVFEKEKLGKMYGIKYFADGVCFRINALSKSFDKLHSIEFFSHSMKPKIMIPIKSSMGKKDIITIIGSALNDKSMKRRLSESYDSFNERKEIKIDVPDVSVPDLSGYDRMMKVQLAAGLATVAIPIVTLLTYYGIKALNAYREKKLFFKGELERDKKIFKGQSKNDNAFKLYQSLVDHIEMLLDKQANGLILAGPPGTSKTYMVRRTLYFNGLKHGKDYMIESGASLSMESLYTLLWKNKNRILILDDFDEPLKSGNAVNMLKAVTDTQDRRIISLPKEASYNQQQTDASLALPSKFEFKGQLIIITNLPPSQVDSALKSRAPLYHMNMNAKQIMGALERLIKYIKPEVPDNIKREVYTYIQSLYKKNKNITFNFRTFLHSVEARQRAMTKSMDWKGAVQVIVGHK